MFLARLPSKSLPSNEARSSYAFHESRNCGDSYFEIHRQNIWNYDNITIIFLNTLRKRLLILMAWKGGKSRSF